MMRADVAKIPFFPRNLIVIGLRGARSGILDRFETNILKQWRCHAVIPEIIAVIFITIGQREVVIVVDQSRNRYINRRFVKVTPLSILDRKRICPRRGGK